jgi:DGQHR domain-containing protein
MTKNNGHLEIDVLKLSQPAGEFFVGSMNYYDLLEIAYYDPRIRIDEAKYKGIQRPLNKDRIKAINAYLTSLDATLPNAIIASLHEGFNLNETPCRNLYKLVLERRPGLVLIVDGQHRLEGFRGLQTSEFDIIVTFLVGMQEEDEAMIFATINGTQTRVNPSLVYDLFGLTSGRSPQKTVHEIVKRLNTEAESPFYKQIKMLGRKEDDYTGIISQSAFAKKLMQFISKDPLRDRNLIAKKQPLPYNSREEESLIFLAPFREQRDDFLYAILKNYFNAIKELFPQKWGMKSYLLTKSIGIHAYMEYLRFIYPEVLITKNAQQTFFMDVLKATKTNNELTSAFYSPNEQGIRIIFTELVSNSRYPWKNEAIAKKIRQ